jgi:hypothetical protein
MTDNNTKSRTEKLEELGLNDKNYLDLSDDVINKLYIDIMQKKKLDVFMRGMHVSKAKYDKLDKNDPRYKLTLEILNIILVKLNMDKIDVITNFKNIKRDDLMKQIIKTIFSLHTVKIVELFSKYNVVNFQKVYNENYVINMIRSLVTYCGYNFLSKQKKFVNGYVRIYSIV